MARDGLHTARFCLTSAGNSITFLFDGEPFEITGEGGPSLLGASIPVPGSACLACHSIKR